MGIFKKSQPLEIQRSPSSVRSEKVILEKTESISRGGGYARRGVYSGAIRFVGDSEKTQIPMVIKAYNHPGPQYEATFKSLMERISKIHKQMRDEGFRVPRTLRFDMARHFVIMTDLNINGHVALSCNNDSDLIGDETLKELPTFEKTASNLFNEAIRAGAHAYGIHSHCYMMLVPQKTGVETDFVIADFDSLEWNPKEEVLPKETALIYVEHNLTEAHSFLREFIEKFVTPDMQSHYLSLASVAHQKSWNSAKRKAFLKGA